MTESYTVITLIAWKEKNRREQLGCSLIVSALFNILRLLREFSAVRDSSYVINNNYSSRELLKRSTGVTCLSKIVFLFSSSRLKSRCSKYICSTLYRARTKARYMIFHASIYSLESCLCIHKVFPAVCEINIKYCIPVNLFVIVRRTTFIIFIV